MTIAEVFRAVRFACKPYLTRFAAEKACAMVHFNVPWGGGRVTGYV